ncbi:unnamed protein product [Cuscuta campestris]|uniref:BZIP domain-containing protein n=1 Tax=Cuscuta campestris TaxID=132261 RepID=A0A484K9I0_9ASTE|nr:unnamed protein product [Cuscuta campestris]
MANAVVADPLVPPANAALTDTASMADDLGDPLPFPPMDPLYFSECDEILMDDLDFDFSFDDLNLPSDVDSFLDPNFLLGPVDRCDPALVHHVDAACHLQPGIGPDPIGDLRNSSSESCQFSGDQIDGDAVFLNSSPPGMCPCDSRVLIWDSSGSHQIFGDLSGDKNVSSPDSNCSNKDSQGSANGNQGYIGPRVLSCHSPDSQGSGNCSSNVSSAPKSSSECLNQSLNSSLGSEDNSLKIYEVVHNFKSDEMNSIHNNSTSALKRKNQGESDNVTNRKSKCRKPIDISHTETNNTNTTSFISEEEEKKRARLIRNRESAQLSRQRKKNYVEELEGKVRTMHSTINELTAKISYVMAENACLRQQIGGGGVGMSPANPPPPPGVYAPVMYPWMPCTPPYFVKPQGSNVPLVPIPRLKPQQSVSSTKKKERKIKTAASVSFLGLFFFILMFGGLVPMINVRYGGMKEAVLGGNYVKNGLYDNHRGRVLAANGTGNCVGFGNGKHFSDGFHCGETDHNGDEPNVDLTKTVYSQNGSEPLTASLYVPRNDKLVKIDGNLIIHSILASEKAMTANGSGEMERIQETGLAIPSDFPPSMRNSHMYQGPAEGQKALVHGYVDRDNFKRSTSADGQLQQWFHEGLSRPLLSSGMCTEVFQFEVSSAIVPATFSSSRNVSIEPSSQNATSPYTRQQNRRILRSPIPISSSPSQNTSEENARRNGHKENTGPNRGTLAPPLVVSVLVDPRDAAATDGGESMMGTKTLSRIFVVVLIDSVKYVTYSCLLPLKVSVRH